MGQGVRIAKKKKLERRETVTGQRRAKGEQCSTQKETNERRGGRRGEEQGKGWHCVPKNVTMKGVEVQGK